MPPRAPGKRTAPDTVGDVGIVARCVPLECADARWYATKYLVGLERSADEGLAVL